MTGDDARPRGAEEGAPEPHTGCPHACPLCLTLETFQAATPEVAQHLLAAATELLLAMRSVFDAAGEVLREAEERSGGASGVESIPIQRD